MKLSLILQQYKSNGTVPSPSVEGQPVPLLSKVIKSEKNSWRPYFTDSLKFVSDEQRIYNFRWNNRIELIMNTFGNSNFNVL